MTASIVKLDHRQQTKFVCSACGSGRDCDCSAPALERPAELKEQARQRQIKKREQNQEPRHVTYANNKPQVWRKCLLDLAEDIKAGRAQWDFMFEGWTIRRYARPG